MDHTVVRVRPGAWISPRGVVVLLVAAFVAAALTRVLSWPAAVALTAVATAVVFAFDARVAFRAFDLRRIAPERYALARAGVFRYVIVNRADRALRCGIIESPVARLAIPLEEIGATVPPRSNATIELGFVPRERGRSSLVATYAWYEAGWRLIRHRVRVDGAVPIRVMPDLSALDSTTDIARRTRPLEAGLRRLRRRGGGTEFESLREYAPGDAFRSIDWKASARRGRTMVVQHEVERSQQIVVAIDAGRLMSARLNDRRKLDYAVSATLGIAAAARVASDRIGVHAFAGHALATLAPASGTAHTAALVEVLSDLEPRFEESDYERAALDIGRAHRKRGLVIVFTDLFDPITSSAVLASLGLLVKRHLVVVALINDAAITDALDRAPTTVTAAYEAAVARNLAAERARAVATLRARGMIVVDVPARDLTLALLDAYVEIKLRARL